MGAVTLPRRVSPSRRPLSQSPARSSQPVRPAAAPINERSHRRWDRRRCHFVSRNTPFGGIEVGSPPRQRTTSSPARSSTADSTTRSSRDRDHRRWPRLRSKPSGRPRPPVAVPQGRMLITVSAGFDHRVAVGERDLGVAKHLRWVVVDEAPTDGPGDLRVRCAGERRESGRGREDRDDRAELGWHIRFAFNADDARFTGTGRPCLPSGSRPSGDRVPRPSPSRRRRWRIDRVRRSALRRRPCSRCRR
jgi:hypothetical protein